MPWARRVEKGLSLSTTETANSLDFLKWAKLALKLFKWTQTWFLHYCSTTNHKFIPLASWDSKVSSLCGSWSSRDFSMTVFRIWVHMYYMAHIIFFDILVIKYVILDPQLVWFTVVLMCFSGCFRRKQSYCHDYPYQSCQLQFWGIKKHISLCWQSQKYTDQGKHTHTSQSASTTT